MIKFTQLISKLEESVYHAYEILSEQFHHEVDSILNSDSDPRNKLNSVVKKVRELSDKGIDSGLINGKPKKGSSRAVLFSSTPETIHIDGKEAQVHTATKIAFKGQLDAHTGDSMLLGEHQNALESDWHIINNYSALARDHSNGDSHYRYNEHGVTLPILDESSDNFHWLKGVKLDKFSSKDMQEFTKNDEFKKGITHKTFKMALQSEFAHANGKSQPYGMTPEVEKAKEHPYVNSAISMMFDSGMNPADLDSRNMGTFVHPHTGVRHPLILDYGYSDQIGKLYNKARRAKYKY